MMANVVHSYETPSHSIKYCSLPSDKIRLPEIEIKIKVKPN